MKTKQRVLSEFFLIDLSITEAEAMADAYLARDTAEVGRLICGVVTRRVDNRVPAGGVK